ncbi:zinc ABC transporter substrate-binding protein [Aliiroseovarius sediminis]|uniref:zinc ABC transporter substrate-binding protein n=1 Tax=Aliiroseovarius sediminis TaxID=2925839 RepID=UPI001F5ADC48|nr:zinc ABC transporter substrate-binding protein [Aliiroseovarius sediminis]MCI2394067.1 zinc ABC transporter substrate-binding protein [Aliiroseovarius sediminis]
MKRLLLSTFLLIAAPAHAETPQVIADIAPVHSLVAAVMGDVASPDLLMPQGADPHAFQMRPSQMRALSQADLVFWVGSELTPWLDRALQGVSDAQSFALLDAPGTHLRESDHAHGAEDHDHEGHAHDPHAWLSPDNGAAWLTTIADVLADLDPDNAQTYHENAAREVAALAQLDAAIDAQLAPVGDRGFIVFHDAYGYFTDHYGLTTLGAVRESDSASPSAAKVKSIRELVSGGQVHCAFAEVAEGQDMMRDLVAGTAARVGTLDPSGTNLTPGPALYGELLHAQAQAIFECLAGGGE